MLPEVILPKAITTQIILSAPMLLHLMTTKSPQAEVMLPKAITTQTSPSAPMLLHLMTTESTQAIATPLLPKAPFTQIIFGLSICYKKIAFPLLTLTLKKGVYKKSKEASH